MQLPQKFTMQFEPMTIEHLGLRLYSTLPPVISEFVSNAYDAESPKVEVLVPETMTSDAEVVVRDWGHGLAPDEVQREFLPIGRNRRGSDSTNMLSKNGKVRVTGRKGLGKLSGLGIADELELRAVRDRFATCLRLNYQDMKAWAAAHGPSEPFEPAIVTARSGPTQDANGVEIRLRKLHRKYGVPVDQLRKGLSMRLAFIGKDFEVRVNGQPVRAYDRRKDCRKWWNVTDIPPKHGALTGDLKVTGWIGYLADTSSAGRGVNIYASKKAVEIGSFFNSPSTHAQFARAYLIGEVHAQFLDDETDLAATARNSVVWESEQGQALQDWGRDAITWVAQQWLDDRQQRKEKEIIKAAGFDRWLETRTNSEQKVANRMVSLLAKDEKLDPESAEPLLEIVKASVETLAFRDLVDELEAGVGTPTELLRLFQEWRIIEAREHLKLADGRLEAIDKLAEFMNEGALEVKQMQPLFERNPWLIDPTWTEVEGQSTYSKLLREEFEEGDQTSDEERRLDLLGIRVSGTLTIVELKRPEATLSKHHLRQIEDYVDWARGKWLSASGPDAVRYVSGLLLVGKMSKSGEMTEKIRRAAGDHILVETYQDLHHRASEYYATIERVLRKIAPEYSREARRGQRAR